MKKTISQLFFISSFLLISQLTKAQLVIQHAGFIIQKDGTKLPCFIKEDTHFNYMQGFSYRMEGEAKFTKVAPSKFRGFEIPSKELRFVAFEIEEWAPVIGRNSDFVPYRIFRFLKQIERGSINLYEYRSPVRKHTMLYVEKGNTPLVRLEVLKKYRKTNGQMVLDTLFNSSRLKVQERKYKVQKLYLALLANYTKDCPNLPLDQNLLLNKESIRSLVYSYNQCKRSSTSEVVSYGTSSQRIRLHFFSNFFFKEDIGSILPQPGLELEGTINENNNISFSLGFTRVPIQHSVPGIESYRIFGAIDPNEVLFMVYLKAKYYFLPSSKLKPHIYYRFDTYSGSKVGPIIAVNSFGGGVTYLTGNKGFLTLGVNLRPQIDLQLGYGFAF